MVNEKVAKNIIEALRTNDNRLLTLDTLKWINLNHPLKPEPLISYHLDWNSERIKRKGQIPKEDYERFVKTFSLIDFVLSDFLMNYILSFYLHGKWDIQPLRNKADTINYIRERLSLKGFRIKYSHSIFKCKIFQVARNELEAIKIIGTNGKKFHSIKFKGNTLHKYDLDAMIAKHSKPNTL